VSQEGKNNARRSSYSGDAFDADQFAFFWDCYFFNAYLPRPLFGRQILA
jgi:hypothetical protein